MPCYTTYTATVPLTWDVERTDISLLARALEDMGFTVTAAQNINLLTATHPQYGTVTYSQGRIQQTMRNSQDVFETRDLKRSYNKRTIHAQAKKMGWRCPQPGTPQYAKNDWSVGK